MRFIQFLSLIIWHEFSYFLHNLRSKKTLYSEDFINFCNKNKNYWLGLNNNNSDLYIAINCTNHHPMNMVQNLILGKYLQYIYGYKLIVIDNYKNKYRQMLYDSYNVCNFSYFNNFFYLLRNFFKSYLTYLDYIKKIKNISDLINIKINNIDIGKIAYDDFLRNQLSGTENSITLKIRFYFFKTIFKNYIINNIISKKIKIYITHETQFIPDAILFQNFLLNKTIVFVKGIGQTEIGLRKFSKISQRYYNRHSISKQLFLNCYNSSKQKEYEKKGYEIRCK